MVTLDTTRTELDPFGISPDLRFIFLDAELRRARRALLAELHRGIGVTLVYGSRGIGKTMLLRSLAADLTRSDRSLISMSCIASPSEDSILTNIRTELSSSGQIELALDGIRGSRLADNVSVTEQRATAAILLLDDADGLTSETLACVTRLPREAQGNGNNLSIVLAGSSKLLARLDAMRDPSIKQPIDLHVSLSPLNFQDVQSYILHRLRTAGRTEPHVFEPDAIERIAYFSDGNPQAINRICRAAMVRSENHLGKSISADLINQVAPAGSDPATGTTIKHIESPVLTAEKSSRPSTRIERQAEPLNQSKFSHSVFTEPALDLTVLDETSRRTERNRAVDDNPCEPDRPADLAVPSGRELKLKLSPTTDAISRRPRHVASKVAWTTIGAMSAAGAAVLVSVFSDNTTERNLGQFEYNPTTQLQENTQDTLEKGSPTISSPRQRVEPPQQHSPEALLALNPSPLPKNQQLGATPYSETSDLSREPPEPKTEPLAPGEGAALEGMLANSAHSLPNNHDRATQSASGSALHASNNSFPDDTYRPVELNSLIQKGDQLLSLGDVASARLVYRLAALDGSAAAATSMGSTYDPLYLEKETVSGTRPSPAQAIKWYKKAILLGGKLAEGRLRDLTASLDNAKVRDDADKSQNVEKPSD